MKKIIEFLKDIQDKKRDKKEDEEQAKALHDWLDCWNFDDFNKKMKNHETFVL